MARLVTLSEDAGAAQPLFVDFVNTLHWYEGVPIELIGNQADLARWLAEHALAAVALEDSVSALHALRQHARAATQAIATGKAPAAVDLAALSAALGAPTGRLVLGDAENSHPQLAFELDGDDHMLAALQIALSLANFLESGERQRLKLCANPACGFAFLDTSTNGTRRWCFMRYCGNRLKLRAYRRRHTGRREPQSPPISRPR
jgi:predicted RNA-binding Zn ribbon-like protein